MTQTQAKQPIEFHLKLSTSAHNKELLEFLHRNVERMSVYYKLHINIVKSSKAVSFKLPAVEIDDNITSGTDEIIAILKALYIESRSAKPVRPLPTPTDSEQIQEHFLNEMRSGEQEEDNTKRDMANKVNAMSKARNNTEVPKSAKNRSPNVQKSMAITSSQQHSKKKTRDPKPQTFTNDPIAQAFWDKLEAADE